MKEYIFLKDFILSSTFESEVKHKVVHFKQDDIIISPSKIYPNFYFIKEGAVKVVVSEGHFGFRTDAQPIVSTLSKYHTFGEMGLFDNSPAAAEVVAILDTEVIEIEKKSFIAFLDANPETGYKIMVELFEAMAHQIRRQNKNLYHLIQDR